MGAAGWLLERKLGMPLLDRATRPLALTADGRLYYGLAAARGRISGSRRTRGLGVIGLSEMSRPQEVFSRRFPKAQLHVDYSRLQKIRAT